MEKAQTQSYALGNSSEMKPTICFMHFYYTLSNEELLMPLSIHNLHTYKIYNTIDEVLSFDLKNWTRDFNVLIADYTLVA